MSGWKADAAMICVTQKYSYVELFRDFNLTLEPLVTARIAEHVYRTMLKYSWQVHGLVNFYCEDYLTTIVSRVNQATHSVATLDSAVSLLSQCLPLSLSFSYSMLFLRPIICFRKTCHSKISLVSVHSGKRMEKKQPQQRCLNKLKISKALGQKRVDHHKILPYTNTPGLYVTTRLGISVHLRYPKEGNKIKQKNSRTNLLPMS